MPATSDTIIFLTEMLVNILLQYPYSIMAAAALQELYSACETQYFGGWR